MDVKCGAKTRGGKPCRNTAGKKTDHVGEGRCWLHGGLTPVKHGRYSKVKSRRIAELLTEFEADDDPLNLKPEVILLRALILDYVNRYDEFTAALIAWHNSFGPTYDEAVKVWRDEYDTWREKLTDIYETGWQDVDKDDLPAPPEPPDPFDYQNKPRQVIDILSAGKFIVQIGSLVERIEKQKQEGTVSLDVLDRYLTNLGEEVVAAARETIDDNAVRTAVLEAITRRWKVVKLADRDPVPGVGDTAGARTIN